MFINSLIFLILYSKQHKPRRKMDGVIDNLNKWQVRLRLELHLPAVH
jgi:hypothetical protein